jgi:hypothetical protein
LTAPYNNLELGATLATLTPNEALRSQVLEHKKAKTQEWKDAERRWLEWEERQQRQKQQQQRRRR